MAIAVSIQLELVGEDPLLEVGSFISEAIIKAPKITDIVPNDVFISVLEYVSKQFSLITLSCGLTREVLEPITADFGGEMATIWQFNAAKQDYFLECGISGIDGVTKWLCTIEVIANYDEEQDSDAESEVVPTTGTMH